MDEKPTELCGLCLQSFPYDEVVDVQLQIGDDWVDVGFRCQQCETAVMQ